MRLKKRRTLRIKPLDQRAMLAVMTIAPADGESPAALLSEAIANANSTEEADRIELSSGVYNLAELSAGTLEINSDIQIVGTVRSV